jgi:transposase-like protein
MGRKKQIDTSMYFCPYPDCPNHGKVGPDNQIIGAGCYGPHQTQLLKCKVCHRTFSERRGTPLFNLKASEETFYDVIACLAEAVSRYLMVNLHFEEAQLDEFWSFVKKRKHTAQL